MEYIGAGFGSLVLGIGLALCGLYVLAYKIVPAIKRAVGRFDTEAREVRDIGLEAFALERLRELESLSNSREQQWGIDVLYADGKLPSYVPDGLRRAAAITSIIVVAQDQRASEREALLARADRHHYATA